MQVCLHGSFVMSRPVLSVLAAGSFSLSFAFSLGVLALGAGPTSAQVRAARTAGAAARNSRV